MLVYDVGCDCVAVEQQGQVRGRLDHEEDKKLTGRLGRAICGS